MVGRFVLAALLLVLGHVSALAEERFALLIGNSRYEQATPLRNPENDIEVVGQSLQAVGFKTYKVKNATLAQLNAEIDAFLEKLRGSERPVAVVYFAGHGIQRSGQNLILPVDVDISNETSLERTALRIDDLLTRLSEADTELRIIVLDACRNDPFEAQSRSATQLKQGLAEIPRASGQVVAFSTAPGKVADDGNTGTSPYASVFAEAVLLPGLPLRTVFDRIREKVRERTRAQQEPWESSATYGDFHFVPPVQSVEISEVEALLWDNVALLDSSESYQRYIDRFPTGRFAALARQKIDNINTDFRYRRKAETFPIITAGPEFDFCRLDIPEATSISNGFDVLNGLFPYQDELIYVHFVLPLRNVLCKKEIGQIDLAVISTEKKRCSDIISNFGGKHAATVLSCVTSPDSVFEEDWAARLKRDGGLSLVQNSESLQLSALDQDSYHYQFNEVEGDVNQASVSIRGLVRVRIVTIEDRAHYFLEPVDAAEKGLTWKYQNTLEAFRQGGDVSGAEIFTLRERVEKNIAESEAYERAALKSYWDWDGTVVSLSVSEKSRWITVVRANDEREVNGFEEGTVIFEGDANDDSDTASMDGTAFVQVPGCFFDTIDAQADFGQGDDTLSISGDLPRYDETCNETADSSRMEITLKYLGSPSEGYTP